MNMLAVSCPSCGFSRDVPADRVPDGARRVTCPKCRNTFIFTKPVSTPPSAGTAPPFPPPVEPPPPQSEQPRPSCAPGADAAPDPPPVRRRPKPEPPKKLTDIGALFAKTWHLFQSRFTVLIGLYLLAIAAFILPVAATAGVSILAGMAKGGVAFLLSGLLGSLVGIYLGFRCIAAFLYAVVEDQLGFGEALEKGKGLILPLAWVGLLTGIITVGGFMLLVVPGIIFMVWFFFAQFILAKEDIRGMGALLKSREYVRGEWFDVALRLLLVWAASVLLGSIPLAGPILCIAFFPFVMIFHYLLYEDLRELKGDVCTPCGTYDVLKWPAVGLFGLVFVPIAAVSFLGLSLFGKLREVAPSATATIVQEAAKTGNGAADNGWRVVTFPQKSEPSATPVTAPAGQPASSFASSAASPSPFGSQEEYPPNIHVFVYAVNYTGTVKANGTAIKELEGKPDTQYSYNMDGKGLRYGQNEIEIDYAELPSPPSNLLEVHVKVSRFAPGKPREILGDWRFKDKRAGKKTFAFDIPK